MKKENLNEAQELMSHITAVESDLSDLKSDPPTGMHMMYSGRHLPEKAAKEIYGIAVRALTNKRRSLMRKFNKI